MNSSNWQFVFFRYFASFLFILSHSLLVLDHLPVGAALHGLGEVFIAPWAFRERAWDLVVIAVLFFLLRYLGSYKHSLELTDIIYLLIQRK